MNNIKFYFHANGGSSHMVYPFRVGDIVSVEDWEQTYPLYISVFKHFTGNTNTPFYSIHYDKRSGNIQFKIKNIIYSLKNKKFICYIEDREHKGAVISLNGLKLIKQFPLRKNESFDITIETLNK